MAATLSLRPDTLDRMVRAVEKVRDRLLRATSILEAAGIPYAVAGGNAVAAWVAQADEAAVRNTRDVDILLRRSDLPAATAAFEAAGFHYRHVAGLDMFLDGPGAKAAEAVHVLFAGEKIRPDDSQSNPNVEESVPDRDFRILSLEALLKLKLHAWRRKDQVHIEDMLKVGLIDESWVARFPGELGDRLQYLIDTPEG